MLFKKRTERTYRQKFSNFVLPKKGLKRAYQYIWFRVMRIGATPHSIGLGFACGAFASFTPFLGFHFLLAAAIAFCFRASLVSSAFGTAVGNPITFPFILPATYEFGSYLLGSDASTEDKSQANVGELSTLFADIMDGKTGALGELFGTIKPMLLGGVPMGIICGLLSYFIVKAGVGAYQNARAKKLSERAEANKIIMPDKKKIIVPKKGSDS